MDIQAQLAQAALDEQHQRLQHENEVAEAADVGRVRTSRGRRLLDVITIGTDADIAVISERTINGATTRVVYQVVVRVDDRRIASHRVHLSLDLALLHLVEIRAAIASVDSLSRALSGDAYLYAARVLNVTEEV